MQNYDFLKANVVTWWTKKQIWAALWAWENTCKFTTSLHSLIPSFLPSLPKDEMIWDKLIEKTSSACLREVLLMEPDTLL